ncbi:hypothetical protein [Kitasatospora purpeofusca]|uniref:hypothetical protein n=1 Tax=Kitasatospora purpeofusca TaxID=67352 RepID=UPI00381CABE6
MRCRSSLGVALGALALTVGLPTPAGAATGQFVHTYNRDGKTLEGSLRTVARRPLAASHAARGRTAESTEGRSFDPFIRTIYADIFIFTDSRYDSERADRGRGDGSDSRGDALFAPGLPGPLQEAVLLQVVSPAEPLGLMTSLLLTIRIYGWSSRR